VLDRLAEMTELYARSQGRHWTSAFDSFILLFPAAFEQSYRRPGHNPDDGRQVHVLFPCIRVCAIQFNQSLRPLPRPRRASTR